MISVTPLMGALKQPVIMATFHPAQISAKHQAKVRVKSHNDGETFHARFSISEHEIKDLDIRTATSSVVSTPLSVTKQTRQLRPANNSCVNLKKDRFNKFAHMNRQLTEYKGIAKHYTIQSKASIIKQKLLLPVKSTAIFLQAAAQSSKDSQRSWDNAKPLTTRSESGRGTEDTGFMLRTTRPQNMVKQIIQMNRLLPSLGK